MYKYNISPKKGVMHSTLCYVTKVSNETNPIPPDLALTYIHTLV